MPRDLKVDILRNIKNLTIHEAHGILNVLDFPTNDNYEDFSIEDYVSRSIASEDNDEKLRKLLVSIKEDDEKTTSGIKWKDSHYRLFISHSSVYKNDVQDLKTKLFDFGIHGFVAHEDINVSSQWAETLIDALKTVDGFLAYITDNFTESFWCSQETGYACVNGLKIIPLKVHSKGPKGFLSFFQAANVQDRSSLQIAEIVAENLLKSDYQNYISCLLNSLDTKANYTKTSYILILLSESEVSLSREDFQRLEQIHTLNDQVSGYFHSSRLLNEIRDKVSN